MMSIRDYALPWIMYRSGTNIKQQQLTLSLEIPCWHTRRHTSTYERYCCLICILYSRLGKVIRASIDLRPDNNTYLAYTSYVYTVSQIVAMSSFLWPIQEHGYSCITPIYNYLSRFLRMTLILRVSLYEGWHFFLWHADLRHPTGPTPLVCMCALLLPALRP